MSWDWIRILNELNRTQQPFVLVTVGRCNGSTPRETGAKMIVTPNQFWGTIGGGQLENLAISEARECLKTARAKCVDYPLHASAQQCCGGVVQMIYEPVNVGPRLSIFGGGHVGQALARVLEDTPFQYTLIDERPEWVQPPLSWKTYISERTQNHSWDCNRDYVAILTHSHETDFEILKSLLKTPLRYLGLIGSETKWKSFQGKFSEEGCTESDLQRIHCPIGLELGGKSPKEVAISIAAELLKTHYGRP